MSIDKNTKRVMLENIEIKRIMSEGGVLWEMNTVPGPTKLIAGNSQAGFYGEVPTSEFITGEELASKIGLTAGVSQFSDEPWLKFSYLGKIEFIAKKTFRHSISWDSLLSVSAIWGNKVIDINGNNYKIRLIKGRTEGRQGYVGDDPSMFRNSEWNRLMLPIHIKASGKVGWYNSGGVDRPLENWDINYSSKDLSTYKNYSEKGYYSWCQENAEYSYYTLSRGGEYDPSGWYGCPSNHPYDKYGWRPVLELVD